MGAASHDPPAGLPAPLRSVVECGDHLADADQHSPLPQETEQQAMVLRLPAEAARLSVLRRRLEDFLTAHGVPEGDIFDVIMAVSEAAANAVEHPIKPAEPVICVEVAMTDDAIVATVRDTGTWRPETAPGFRGRGLALISALAELTVERSQTGTAVTLRRALAS